MQKSITQALEKWKFDEVIQEAMLKKKNQPEEPEKSDKFRGIGQLMKFARTPSSAQVIFEQKRKQSKREQ